MRYITTIYILLVFFIPNTVALINKPGIPLISVNRVYLFIWIAIFLYVSITRRKIRYHLSTYPFYKPMFFVMLSMIIITIFAQNIMASMNSTLSFLTESFTLSMMIWVAYCKSRDIASIMHKLVLIFVGLSIYGTVSYLIGINPIVDILSEQFSSESRSFALSYSDSERIGLRGRAQSIFPHSIQYGALLVMALGISYYHYIADTNIRKYLNLPYIAILAVGILTTNSRSPLIFILATALVYFYYQSVTKKLALATIALIVVFLALPFANHANVQLITSLLIEIFGGESGVGGSSIAMRIEQLSASLSLFNEAPIVGHGLAATRIMLESGAQPEDLRRAEGFLFSLMIDGGTVGVIAYAYFYSFLTYYFIRQRKYLVDRYLVQLPIIVGALVMGYVVFIMATGVLDTFRLFIIIVTLTARYMYLELHPTQERATMVTGDR